LNANALGRLRMSSTVNADAPVCYDLTMLVAKEKGRRSQRLARRAAPGPASLENVLASLADAVIITDEDDCITTFNQAAEELTGLSQAQVRHRSCADVFTATPRLAAMACLTRTLGQNQSCGEEIFLARQGPVPVRVSSSPIRGQDGQIQGTALVIQDLSYQKKLEDEVRRNQTLARLGGVVAGLAHEVKNPLGGIKGAAQLLAQRFADQPDIAECTGIMVREIDRLARLVEQLLTLGAPPAPKLAPVNIHKVLKQVLALTETELSAKNIAVRLQIDPSLPDVSGEEGQLTQVFLNLMKNALEAMPGRGSLTVTTRMETDFYIRRLGGAAGPGAIPPEAGKFLRVELADSGPGFGAADLERVFEPFFTTKARGSGLGLAICERIVAAHGGDIHVGNARGGGAVVTVTLPVVHS
jgi:two-component system nitrogen regulation sensor histidine kinase GlnL